MKIRPFVFGLVLVTLVSACGSPPAATEANSASTSPQDQLTASAPGPSPAVVAAVNAPGRSDADRALDLGRRPAEVLSFFGIAPGQRVADLFAGGGYTTELLSRIVGPSGQVFCQNNAFVLDRFARAPLAARLSYPELSNVVTVEQEFDAPLPPSATELDAVIFILAYHDTVWLNTDRAAMNRAIFAALRSGGVYGIVDHHAEAASGVRDVQTLHRIERQVVVDEILAAGFRLDAESNVLENAGDTRDWNASPVAAGEQRGTSDRFVLRFVKP